MKWVSAFLRRTAKLPQNGVQIVMATVTVKKLNKTLRSTVHSDQGSACNFDLCVQHVPYALVAVFIGRRRHSYLSNRPRSACVTIKYCFTAATYTTVSLPITNSAFGNFNVKNEQQ